MISLKVILKLAKMNKILRKTLPVSKGNINLTLLVSLVVLICGSAIICMGVNSKWSERQSYERIANRYVAECGVDVAVGLFENHMAAQNFIITYTQNTDGSYEIIDQFSPYLLDEIRQSANVESVPFERISAESCDYLAGIGFLEFKRQSGIDFQINIFNQKENFKLSRMCIEPDFLISMGIESNIKRSKINPIYLTVKSRYKNGEVLCSIEISGLYMMREAFKTCGIGELGAVKAWIDTTYGEVKYVAWQNYRRR